ncbi:hypothetical protein ABZ297_14290 [Nonomuraea sp. NPDC005983]
MQITRLIIVATVAAAILFTGAVSANADTFQQHAVAADTPWD